MIIAFFENFYAKTPQKMLESTTVHSYEFLAAPVSPGCFVAISEK
jgi:hypothetical protein